MFAGPMGRSTATAPATSSAPDFLGADWDEELPMIEPAFLRVENGMPLIYAGESHMIYGEGGSGKSWLLYHLAAEMAKAGHVVLLIDYESNRRTLRERMRAMGVTQEHASRIAYWRLSAALTGRDYATLLDFCARHEVSLVGLDSVAKAMAAAGFSENENSDFIAWDGQTIVPLTMRGITSVVIDHTGHEQGFGAARTRQARGASSKRDQVSGASYHWKAESHWTREASGHGTLTVSKDREGWRKKHEIAALVNVLVTDEGKGVAITFLPPSPASAAPTEQHHGPYMERISRHLEDAGEDSGKGITERARLGDKRQLARAITRMVEDGVLEKVTGRQGGGNRYRLAEGKTYREADDPTSSKHKRF